MTSEKLTQRVSRARTHTRIELLDLFGARSKLSTVGLWLYGQDLLSLLQEAGPGAAPYSSARFFAVTRSIELFLKAFLSAKGRSLVDLSSTALAHDLERLLDLALSMGLGQIVSLDQEQQVAIRKANKYYVEKVFEYPAVLEAIKGYKQLPEFATLLAAAKLMSKGVEPLALAA